MGLYFESIVFGEITQGYETSNRYDFEKKKKKEQECSLSIFFDKCVD